MTNVSLHKRALILLLCLFGLLTIWWLALPVVGESSAAFSSLYGTVALCAGVYGLIAARSWGYFGSHFGKAIIFLSLGLLLQEFGQLSFSYLDFVAHISIPYPGVPDIGFFGSIPMYMLGAFYLMRGLGIGSIVRKNPLKLFVGIVLPLAVVTASFLFFLNGYDPTQKDQLVVFFDFAYPLGQAVYVSMALVIALSLGGLLGGTMRLPILLLLFAFVAQYVADFNFLYQSHQGTWQAAHYGDYLYLLAYFVMGISLVYLNRAVTKTLKVT